MVRDSCVADASVGRSSRRDVDPDVACRRSRTGSQRSSREGVFSEPGIGRRRMVRNRHHEGWRRQRRWARGSDPPASRSSDRSVLRLKYVGAASCIELNVVGAHPTPSYGSAATRRFGRRHASSRPTDRRPRPCFVRSASRRLPQIKQHVAGCPSHGSRSPRRGVQVAQQRDLGAVVDHLALGVDDEARLVCGVSGPMQVRATTTNRRRPNPRRRIGTPTTPRRAWPAPRRRCAPKCSR